MINDLTSYSPEELQYFLESKEMYADGKWQKMNALQMAEIRKLLDSGNYNNIYDMAQTQYTNHDSTDKTRKGQMIGGAAGLGLGLVASAFGGAALVPGLTAAGTAAGGYFGGKIDNKESIEFNKKLIARDKAITDRQLAYDEKANDPSKTNNAMSYGYGTRTDFYK